MIPGAPRESPDTPRNLPRNFNACLSQIFHLECFSKFDPETDTVLDGSAAVWWFRHASAARGGMGPRPARDLKKKKTGASNPMSGTALVSRETGFPPFR